MTEKYQGFFHSELGGITDKTTVFPFAVLTGDYHFPVGIAESVDTDITARSKAKQSFCHLCVRRADYTHMMNLQLIRNNTGSLTGSYRRAKVEKRVGRTARIMHQIPFKTDLSQKSFVNHITVCGKMRVIVIAVNRNSAFIKQLFLGYSHGIFFEIVKMVIKSRFMCYYHISAPRCRLSDDIRRCGKAKRHLFCFLIVVAEFQRINGRVKMNSRHFYELFNHFVCFHFIPPL